MRWRLAAGAEVARGPYQRRAEMMLPNAIDHHPRGERVLFARNRFGQLLSAAAA